MFKKILSSIILIVVSLSAFSNENIVNLSRERIKEKINRYPEYSEIDCLKYASIYGDKKSKLFMCGDFNLAEPLSFSKEKIYKGGDYQSVCGVVSGVDLLGKPQSTEFIYLITSGGLNNTTYFKYRGTKYPYAGDSENEKQFLKNLDDFYRIMEGNYCK